MTDIYTAGSFTKNFSWHRSYKKLWNAIKNGFASGLTPVTRERWRERSGIDDSNRELIPLNFFLFTMHGLNDDFLVVDRLVERAMFAYDINFARLSLFAFHLANSGNWRHSKWSDGRVAGWANELIRNFAWRDGRWRSDAFSDCSLAPFFDKRIDGEEVTKRKVLTNYRYMLASAGVLVDERIQEPDFHAPWAGDATMLFWDRQIFSGELHRSSSARDFEAAFFRHEIYKLLGCPSDQGRAIVLSSYRRYARELLPERMRQLEKLRGLLAA